MYLHISGFCTGYSYVHIARRSQNCWLLAITLPEQTTTIFPVGYFSCRDYKETSLRLSTRPISAFCTRIPPVLGVISGFDTAADTGGLILVVVSANMTTPVLAVVWGFVVRKLSVLPVYLVYFSRSYCRATASICGT